MIKFKYLMMLMVLTAVLLFGQNVSRAQDAEAPADLPPGTEVREVRPRLDTMGLIWIQEGNVKRLAYVVQTGDTLWDIAERYLNSPYYWPKIWERNTFIINPHLIFPGDILYIYPEGLIEKPYTEDGNTIIVVRPIGEDDTSRKFLYQPVSSAGYLATEEVESSGKVVGNPDNVVLLGEGDFVYVDMGIADRVEVGDRYTVFRLSGTENKLSKPRPIIHPITGEPAGYRVLVVGEIEITKTYAETSEAKIMASYREITNGDLITPYLLPLEEEVEIADTQVDMLHGYIVVGKDNNRLFGKNDIVFIDRGSEDGVIRGNIFTVYEPCETITDSVTGEPIRIPEKVTGQLLILEPRAKTSTALIIDSVREISPGDRIMLTKYETFEIEGVSTPGDVEKCKSMPSCRLITAEEYENGKDNPYCEPMQVKKSKKKKSK